MKRRTAIKISTAGILGTAVSTIAGSSEQKLSNKLKVLVFGAHPDDPETGCGGLMNLAAKSGHQVFSAYLTKGEAGIKGKTFSEAAQIRTAEAKMGCDILGVKPIFLTQIDGSTELNKNKYKEVISILEDIQPEMIFTHWPIDTHRDHQVCAVLVHDAWLRLGRNSELYYYEVMSGQQTQNFYPTHYVDISEVVEVKRKACFSHKSQNIKENYHLDHGKMEEFRGFESNSKFAEAFVKHTHSPDKYTLSDL